MSKSIKEEISDMAKSEKNILKEFVHQMEQNKYVTTIALMTMGIGFYLPYFLHIGYFPDLKSLSFYTLLILILVPIVVFILMPLVMVLPVFFWEEFLLHNKQVVDDIFPKVKELDHTLMLIIVLPSVLAFGSGLLLVKGFGFFAFLLFLMFFGLVGFVSYQLKTKSMSYLFSLMASLLYCMLPFLAFQELFASIGNIIDNSEGIVAGSSGFIELALALSFVFIAIWIVYLNVYFLKERSLSKKSLKILLIGWLSILIIVSVSNTLRLTNENPLTAVMVAPARLTLVSLGKGGGERKDILVDRGNCERIKKFTHEVEECGDMNKIDNVKILLDIGKTYVEFSNGFRTDFTKNEKTFQVLTKKVQNRFSWIVDNTLGNAFDKSFEIEPEEAEITLSIEDIE